MYSLKARNRVAEGVVGAVQRELNKNNKIITLNTSMSGDNDDVAQNEEFS